MKICMLRTLYLQSIPQFSARNISVWNRHRSDRLVQNSYFSLVLRHQLSTIQTQTLKTSKLLCVSNTNYSQTWKRQKSKRDSRRSSYEEDSEDDSEEDKFKEAEDDEIFHKYKHYEGDNIATSEPTHRVVHVSSTRVDAVLTKAFGIARAKIEEKLIAQNCLVNGKLLKKKSYQAKVGDCIDLIKEKTDSRNSVQRIRVLDIMEGNSKSGNTKVMIRLWKKAFPVEIS